MTDEFGRTLANTAREFPVLLEISKPSPSMATELLQQNRYLEGNAHFPVGLDRLSSTPNITNKQTVLSFAKMAANAYARKDNSSDWKWQDVGSGFNYTDDFGWEADGLRGHVFADERNHTVVISIKGMLTATL